MDVVVVGAGLAGLTAASALAGEGRTVRVVEARRRVGGRLMTVAADPSTGTLADLGATWHWPDQPRIAALGAEVGLTPFAQVGGVALHDEPGPDPPTVIDGAGATKLPLRFREGAQALCQRLAERLPPGSLTLGSDVTAVAMDGPRPSVTVASPDAPTSTLVPDFVIVAVPPRLALERIRFEPELPGELVAVMRATTTWMADTIKCVSVYESPFWRDAGLSGSAFSHTGPLSEVHDASAPDEPAGALWGLVNAHSAARWVEPAERAPLVLEQLERLFGPPAADPLAYLERDWSADPNTSAVGPAPPAPPLDYGHVAFSRPLFGGRLLLAGAETSSEGGGHMEGAVRSGERAARRILA